MRRAQIVLAIVLSGCKHCDKTESPVAARAEDAASTSIGTGFSTEGIASASGETFVVRDFSFLTRDVAFVIDDLEKKDSLDQALTRSNGWVAINGGFFAVDGSPLGLVVSNGELVSRFSKSMSGGVLEIDESGASLYETESFVPDAHAPSFAIQCRPRLVVSGKPNIRSDDGHRAERTAICIKDGGQRIVLVIARSEALADGGPSLYALARYLTDVGCDDALNLDGGPSTGASWRASGSIASIVPRGPIRHAIVVGPRGTTRDASADEH